MYRHIHIYVHIYIHFYTPPTQTNAVNCNYFIILCHKCSSFPHKTGSEHVGRTTTVYAFLCFFFNTDDNNRAFNIMLIPFDLLPFRRRQNCGVMEQSPPSSHPTSAQDGSLAPEGEIFGSFLPVMLNHLCGYHLLQRVRCLVLFFLWCWITCVGIVWRPPCHWLCPVLERVGCSFFLRGSCLIYKCTIWCPLFSDLLDWTV